MPDDAVNTVKNPQAGERLKPIDRSAEVLPWVRAKQLTRCCLYWIPVRSFPASLQQRAWLLQFFQRLSTFLTTQLQLREENFFQFKALNTLRNTFLNHQMEFMPILGLSRQPFGRIPEAPSSKDIQEMSKHVLETGEAVDVNKYMPDYCYWFAKKSPAKIRELFLGYAALITLFLKPDPKAAPPALPPQMQFLTKRPELKRLDFEGAMATAFALQDGFLPKSKELFGAGLEDEPQFKGLIFILPLLTSADFFGQPEDEAKKWFELCDVYINESPADQGILMAFKSDREEELIGILKKMKEDGLQYPER